MASKRPSQAAVLRRVHYWKKRLNLHEYRVGVEFGPDPDPEAGADADCLAMPEYLEAKVRFDLDAIDPERIDQFVVHELLHIPTWRLVNFASSMCGEDAAKVETLREHNELLVTYLDRLVLALTQETT